jgi:hypothetical protein
MTTQSKGDIQWLSPLLSPDTKYLENGAEINDWTSNSTPARLPLHIDRSHSIFDCTQCASFTDLIATDPASPHVLGAQL